MANHEEGSSQSEASFRVHSRRLGDTNPSEPENPTLGLPASSPGASIESEPEASSEQPTWQGDRQDKHASLGEKGWWGNQLNAHCPGESDPAPNNQVSFRRILPRDAPKLPWRRRQPEEKTTLHWGQRKLLLSELEFLTIYASPGDLLVYAGAAPGTHIEWLARRFPEVHFLLLDPEPFKCISGDPPNLETRECMFTDEIASELAQIFNPTTGANAPRPEGTPNRLLFLSDIRTSNFRIMDDAENEGRIFEDQMAQLRWVQVLRPRASMLKFRLPYTEGQTDYLDGELFLPVWGRQSTTECRLIVDERHLLPGGRTFRTRPWDHKTLWEQLFWFNCHARVRRYAHPVRGVPGLCHCYDCAAEVSIVRDFLLSRGAHSGYSFPVAAASEEPFGRPGEGSSGDLAEVSEVDGGRWRLGAGGNPLPPPCIVYVEPGLRSSVALVINQISEASSRTGRTLAHPVNFWQTHFESGQNSLTMPRLFARLQPWQSSHHLKRGKPSSGPNGEEGRSSRGRKRLKRKPGGVGGP